MIDRDQVERKCAQLAASRFWPREQVLRYRAWLNNFSSDEDVNAAVKILDHFVFISDEHASLAVLDGYLRFLGSLHDLRYGSVERHAETIQKTHATVHFTAVRSESPNPTDSGYTYTRVARDYLKADEQQIVELEDAVNACAQGKPLVLLDDFSGSGNQLLATIRRPLHGRKSILDMVQRHSAVVCCITAVMTDCAISRLRRSAPGVQVAPGYVMPISDYSLNALLPESEHPDVHRLLTKIAPRLRIDGLDPVLGFQKLGLLLGVDDRIPDASLPILWAEGHTNWTPLMARQ